MTLAAYLKNLRLSQRECAAALGVSATAVGRWLAGIDFPSAATQRRIFAWSGGAVTPNDLILPQDFPHTRPVSSPVDATPAADSTPPAGPLAAGGPTPSGTAGGAFRPREMAAKWGSESAGESEAESGAVHAAQGAP